MKKCVKLVISKNLEEQRLAPLNFLTSTLDRSLNFTPRPLYPRKRTPVPTEWVAGWIP